MAFDYGRHQDGHGLDCDRYATTMASVDRTWATSLVWEVMRRIDTVVLWGIGSPGRPATLIFGVVMVAGDS